MSYYDVDTQQLSYRFMCLRLFYDCTAKLLPNDAYIHSIQNITSDQIIYHSALAIVNLRIKFGHYTKFYEVKKLRLRNKNHHRFSYFPISQGILHNRSITYFKCNSSEFGLGTTNCSKTDRKQIYIAVYKVIFPHVVLFTSLFPTRDDLASRTHLLHILATASTE